MNSIILDLESNGMKFDARCNQSSASDYLTYNITWSSLRNSLKQFSRTIEYNANASNNIYDDIYFYDLIQAGLLDYYYNDMIKNLLNEFEQLFKNYFHEVFYSLDKGSREAIINFINEMSRINRFTNDSFEIKDIYELYSFATLAELIDIFNNMLFMHQTLLPYVIPQSFAVFFKDLTNNKGLTLFTEKEDCKFKNHVDNNFMSLTREQIEYLEFNPYNNSCYLAMQLVKITYILHNRHASLDVRRMYTKEALLNSMDKCSVTLSKSNLFDTWVNSHFELLDAVIKETYLT